MDFERWIDSYVTNKRISELEGEFRFGKIMYEELLKMIDTSECSDDIPFGKIMYEELLKMIDTSECSDDIPNNFLAALACDLLWYLTERDKSLTEAQREKRQALNIRLVKEIYPRRDIEKIMRSGDGAIRTLFNSVPYFEASRKVQTKIDSLERETFKFKSECDLMDRMVKRVEDVLQKGVKTWQTMISRAAFRHWRNQAESSKRFRSHFSLLSSHVRDAFRTYSKKSVFQQWLKITHQGKFDVQNKMLQNLEEHNHSLEKEKYELEQKLKEMNARLNLLRARRADKSNENMDLKEKLVKIYRRESVKLLNKAASTLERAKSEKTTRLRILERHITIQETGHLLEFTKIKIEFLKSLVVQYGFKDNVNESYRSILSYLDFMADDLRDIFRFYAKSDGGGRTISESEMRTLMSDLGYSQRKKRNESRFREVFRSVTIRDAQFIEGHCELSPETYV